MISTSIRQIKAAVVKMIANMSQKDNFKATPPFPNKRVQQGLCQYIQL